MLLLCAATAAEMLAAVPAGGLSHGEADFPLFKPVPLRLGREGGVACVTGVGPINAALGMGIALAQCAAAGQQVRAIVNVGLAGSFDLGRWPLRSLHVVREEIWPEYGLHDGRQVVAQAFGYPQWSDGRREVRDRLALAAPAELGLSLREAAASALDAQGVRSLTVAGVSASVMRVQHLRQLYGAALENMEGFAVAYAAARAGLPCLEIRSVSNKVGPRTAEEKDFPGALRQLGCILPALNLV
ncbi:futalosine hydrolase [uncultured Desulfovibrio sp.]|uniref:futalosine hydrolase n=1 Tax=uncultured Desulfovibrio sp. TaxID=167968 RepID=UPI0025DD5E1D|nr:futalosine hydrolase [uncultured Desulfovibrio sp.]